MMPARELDRPSFGDVFMNEYVKKVKELVLNCRQGDWRKCGRFMIT